jgi:hypothetical protein
MMQVRDERLLIEIGLGSVDALKDCEKSKAATLRILYLGVRCIENIISHVSTHHLQFPSSRNNKHTRAPPPHFNTHPHNDLRSASSSILGARRLHRFRKQFTSSLTAPRSPRRNHARRTRNSPPNRLLQSPRSDAEQMLLRQLRDVLPDDGAVPAEHVGGVP